LDPPKIFKPHESNRAVFSFQETEDQKELEAGDGGEQRPEKNLAPMQAALARGGEPELDFGGAEGNEVTIAEPRGGLRLFIDGDKGIRRGVKEITFLFLEFQSEMVVPDTGLIEAQVIPRRATDAKRKMADDRCVARHLSGKNAQLNHQKMLRATSIWSPG
jgi:hypothetical protein